MRISNGQGIAVAFLTACVVAACAADEPQATVADVKPTPTKSPDAPATAPIASGNPAPDAGPPDAGACVEHCTADQDCQTSCPAVSQGTNCCHTASGRCYTAASAACQPPAPDAATPPLGY